MHYSSISPLGSQTCTDSLQEDKDSLGCNTLGIVPRLSFTCSGRITGIIAKVRRNTNTRKTDYPFFQVWRPLSIDSMVYNKAGEVQLQDSQVSQCKLKSHLRNERCIANVVLTGNDTIEFQSGDVVGYYHPCNARYKVRTKQSNEIALYQFGGSPALTSRCVNLNNADDNIRKKQRPLIQFVIGNLL